ncbi:hypothetical protein [Candidatus Rariloculus sp.]|uniref:hypothetical protein n=1 Tax=Candidatus Rariloculus sp. TaxID=3101265 RepID=UPI003D09747A
MEDIPIIVLVFVFVLAVMIVRPVIRMMEVKVKERSGKLHKSVSEDIAPRLAELEERVQVLERIVTDESADLHKQFRDLGK